jgi:flagellar basal body-associated protein FliL
MANLLLPLYSHSNGTFIMIIIFALVCLGLVGAVMLMMNSDKKKKNDQ